MSLVIITLRECKCLRKNLNVFGWENCLGDSNCLEELQFVFAHYFTLSIPLQMEKPNY